MIHKIITAIIKNISLT